jgi:hypothetical protein
MRSTVICHVYNEEYLLPFWLAHHRSIFDHGEIIDYRSTDGSAAIVRSLCPSWTVRTSRNACFDAAAVDEEVMDVERGLDGIKMALNVTEFFFPKRPLVDYFESGQSACFGLEAMTPVSASLRDPDPTSLADLLEGISAAPWARGARMGRRFVHNHPTGRYEVGRHATALAHEPLPDAAATLVWLGFFPWTDRVIRRKLQILGQIPASDVRDRYEIMKQHAMTAEELERRRAELLRSARDRSSSL